MIENNQGRKHLDRMYLPQGKDSEVVREGVVAIQGRQESFLCCLNQICSTVTEEIGSNFRVTDAPASGLAHMTRRSQNAAVGRRHQAHGVHIGRVTER